MISDYGIPYIYEKNGSKVSLMLNVDTQEYYMYYHFPDDKDGYITKEPANIDGATLTRVSDENFDEWYKLGLVKIVND